MTQTFRINNGDIDFGVTGQIKMIADYDKARQDVGEMLSIQETDNFGGGLVGLIGKVDQVDSLRGIIYRQIVGGVNGMIRLQRSRQRAQRPNEEMIDSIQLLLVAVSESDPTSYTFQLQLKTLATVALTLSGTVPVTGA